VPAVFPAAEHLSERSVPPGSRVVTRGAALTFIDAAIALTEGRGGTFTPDAERPGRLTYERSGVEPAVIQPLSRHGLLLDAKPDPGDLPADITAVLEEGRGRVRGLRPTAQDTAASPADVLAEVATTAARLLVVTTGADTDAAHAACVAVLIAGVEEDVPVGRGHAAEALARSIDVADGRRPPGPAWALGRAWQQLYAQVTAALRGCDAPIEEWAGFRAAAAVLERFAFGPPLVNARKLLALIDAGLVDLSLLDAGAHLDADGLHPAPPADTAPDIVIDAVIAPPGLVGTGSPLAADLLTSGLVHLRPGRRGAMVDADATAVGPDGKRTEHLALIGRPTEDDVIGHDTLNRHLHTEIPAWAARLAARLSAHPVSEAPTDEPSPVLPIAVPEGSA
ncbi:MAG: amino acid decarboxylase, partial [Brachybacterium sp.]|nr:amino acid decarboxylase [Brachybacterium sp.]